jgi:hypothetical protein
MSVYVNNIIIDAGEDFSQELTLEDSLDSVVNLTGYGASSYIRKHPESSNVVAGFGISIFNPTQGQLRLSLASTVTATIPEGRYVYDILVTTGAGLKNIVVEGMVTVRAGITTT